MDISSLVCLIYSREHLELYRRFVKTRQRTLIMTVHGPSTFSFPNSYSSSNIIVPKSGTTKYKTYSLVFISKKKAEIEYEI
jgi:hypothetical protein